MHKFRINERLIIEESIIKKIWGHGYKDFINYNILTLEKLSDMGEHIKMR